MLMDRSILKKLTRMGKLMDYLFIGMTMERKNMDGNTRMGKKMD
jgi:hypothetical protein|tara:strand:+ start:380 stop:511 length:132 start_codon:yes stop_codon:yes gene_type:complete